LSLLSMTPFVGWREHFLHLGWKTSRFHRHPD